MSGPGTTFLFTEIGGGGMSCTVTFKGRITRTLENSGKCCDRNADIFAFLESPSYVVMDSYRIHCPFHAEETPSCIISKQYNGPDAGQASFQCLSCGESGACSFERVLD